MTSKPPGPPINGRYDWEQVISKATNGGEAAVAVARDAQATWQREHDDKVAQDIKRPVTGTSSGSWLAENCPADWGNQPPPLMPQIGSDFVTADAQLNRGTTRKFDWRGFELYYGDLRGAELTGVDLSSSLVRSCPSAPGLSLPVEGKLESANFAGALMMDSDWTGAHASGAIVIGTLLYGATMRNVDLSSADLRFAVLDGAILDNANLLWANASEASFKQATFTGAKVRLTNFSGADLSEADLAGVNLEQTNFTGTKLVSADLSFAALNGTNVEGTDFTKADLTGASYDVVGTPSSVFGIKGLRSVTYFENPAGLLALRKKLTDTGLDFNAREITYAFQSRQTQLLLEGKGQPNLLPVVRLIVGAAYLVLFQWTSDWSLDQSRPLVIILALIPLFALLYFFALHRGGKIWRMLPKSAIGAVRTDLWEPVVHPYDNRPLHTLWWRIRTALWFSFLSAFRVGFQQFTIGDWISRIHPTEEQLGARGWARVVAGIQSLISFYLLALAILCIFGRPFG